MPWDGPGHVGCEAAAGFGLEDGYDPESRWAAVGTSAGPGDGPDGCEAAAGSAAGSQDGLDGYEAGSGPEDDPESCEAAAGSVPGVGPERYEAETAHGSWGGPQSCEAVVGFGDDSESSEAGCVNGPGRDPGSQDGLDCEAAAGDRPQPSNYELVAELDSCEPAPGAVTGAGLVVENHELASVAGGGSCETGVGPWAES